MRTITPQQTDAQRDGFADAVFGALADATRRDILRRTMDGDLGVSDIAEAYDMSFAAVQKHVAVLERAGLVIKRRVGRRALVTTHVQALRTAQELLDEYEALWRGRLHRIEDLLGEPEGTTPTQEGTP